MDWLGFGASVLGGLFESASASDAYSNQMAMLERQIEANKETMQNRHQWEVNDLRQAGLNPLMSVASPTGTLSAPSPASVQKANIAQSASALGQLSIANKQAEAQLITAKANEKSAQAAATNADSLRDKTQFEIGEQWSAQKPLLEAQASSALSQANLNSKLAITEGIKNDWLPKIYELDANLKEKQALMAVIVGSAQAEYYHQAGSSALRQAAAAEYVAETGRMLGLKDIEVKNKEIEFKDVDMSRVREEARRIAYQAEMASRENRYQHFNESSGYYRFTRHVGDTIDNLLGVSKFMPH